jgi:hypothetical protein
MRKAASEAITKRLKLGRRSATTIAELQATGVTSLRAIAAGLHSYCARHRDLVCYAGYAHVGTTGEVATNGRCGAAATAGDEGLPIILKSGQLLRSSLQIIGLAQLDGDRLRSQLCAFGVSVRADGDVPASSGIGMHPDIKPFFGEAVSDHFRQFLGGPFWFLHDFTPRLILCAPPHDPLPAAALVTLPQESIFNLRVNTMEPLLRALGSVAVRRDFCF